MISIRFHTADTAVVTVQGAERHHAAAEAVAAAMRVLGAESDPAVAGLVRRGVLPRDATAFTAFGKTPVEAVRMWLNNVTGDAEILLGGERVPVTETVLNTAAVAGPDVVAFLARLHGSVEHRLWVAAEDVAWFTGVLAEGRTSALLRADMGWETVIDRLGAADGPIVISSSQGEYFPDEPEDDLDADPVPEAEAWRDSLARLQQRGWWLQLTPDNLRRPAFAPLATFQDHLEPV